MAFGTKTDEYINKQYIGFYLDENLASHLRLVVLDDEVHSVAAKMVELTEAYLSDKAPTVKLIKKLAVKGIKEWDKQFEKMHGKRGWGSFESIAKRWDTFIKRAEQNLLRRKIDENIAKLIVERMIKIYLERE